MALVGPQIGRRAQAAFVDRARIHPRIRRGSASPRFAPRYDHNHLLAMCRIVRPSAAVMKVNDTELEGILPRHSGVLDLRLPVVAMAHPQEIRECEGMGRPAVRVDGAMVTKDWLRSTSSRGNHVR